MNTIFRQIPIALLFAAAMSAQANIDPQPLPEPALRLQTTAPRQVAETALAALRDGETMFEMSNGRTMVVSAYGDYLQVRYGRRAMKILSHDGQGNFVSRDGRISLQFDIDAYGHAKLARLSAPADWL